MEGFGVGDRSEVHGRLGTLLRGDHERLHQAPSQFDNPAALSDRGGDNAGMKANRHDFPRIEPSRQLAREEDIAQLGAAISPHHRPIVCAAEIPDAAAWADQHHYLTGDALAAAIQADRLPWDPSVQALLPFPAVLDMMASDMNWTRQLGDAFLSNGGAVMDSVQRMRQRAYDYGYLRTNPQILVTPGPYIVIAPANPAFLYVPIYDPLIVYAPPRRGIVVGTVIRFGFGVTLGAAFVPWGWHANRVVWAQHTVIVNDAPWRRTWVNRTTYVHPYTVPRYTVVAPRVAAGSNDNLQGPAGI